MHKNTKIAIAFIALASTISGAALAENHKQSGDRKGHKMPSFSEMDADNSGGVSFDEFLALASKRLTEADADASGTITVEEIVATMGKRGNEARAERMIQMLDVNGDGSLAMEEIRSRTEKRFALMDINDDGEIQAKELPQRGQHMGKRDGKRGEGNGAEPMDPAQ